MSFAVADAAPDSDCPAPMNRMKPSGGALAGVRIVEFGGIGPGPFAAMMMADMGADVVCVLRPGQLVDHESPLYRGRRFVELDLKSTAGLEQAILLLRSADLLIEGFRPGVMERLGLSADIVRQHNPRLVFGRITGWGQNGPLAAEPGHDINYIALTGVLAAIGPRDRPMPPLNLIGDFGGGALYLVVGLLAALWEARSSGVGQVVDCAMIDGISSLMSWVTYSQQAGRWRENREANRYDGAAPFYATYACSDGRFIAVGATEHKFYFNLLRLIGANDPIFLERDNQALWPEIKERLAGIFRSRTRDEWCELLEYSNTCVSPVLTVSEVPNHPHNSSRGTFDGDRTSLIPAPAPRFGRTPAQAWQSDPQIHSVDDIAAAWTRGQAVE